MTVTKAQSLLTYFIAHQYNHYESELERQTLSAVSVSFCYLQTVMRPAASHGCAPQDVAKQLNEIELNITQRARQPSKIVGHGWRDHLPG